MTDKIKEYTVCCDSADLYAWVFKNRPELKKGRNSSNYNRWVCFNTGGRAVKLNFVHKYSNPEGYNKLTHNILAKTAGTPDYILFDELGSPLACVEDSKTAPVGNAVIQRMDKLFPLLADDGLDFPVIYIGPKQGKDESQDTVRGWQQSWFFKCFAGKRKDIFKLLPAKESVNYNTFGYILKVIHGHVCGNPFKKVHLSKHEYKEIHKAMEKNIRTYENGVFSGKLFKNNGTDSHPVQSTLMLISDIRESLGLGKIKIVANDITFSKLEKSKSKRVVRVMNRNPIFELEK